MTSLTHFDDEGRGRMVNVTEKPETERRAVAYGAVEMQPATMALIRNRELAKGDVIEVARLAGIMGAKRTAELIPLCHPLRLTSVSLDVRTESQTRLGLEATVIARDRTGVEMEALTAVSVAALTVYDMCKAVDREITIGPIQLLEKAGGRSGHFRRNA